MVLALFDVIDTGLMVGAVASGTIDIAALLLPDTKSVGEPPERVAVLVIVWPPVPLLTVAVMVSVLDAPFVRLPIVHKPVEELYVVPASGVLLTYVTPDGNWSVTVTTVASLEPLLVAVTVYVTVAPTPGADLSTAFVTAISAVPESTESKLKIIEDHAVPLPPLTVGVTPYCVLEVELNLSSEVLLIVKFCPPEVILFANRSVHSVVEFE